MSDKLWMTVAVLVLVAILAGSYFVRNTLSLNPWADRMLLDKGMELPIIWLYYDTSQVNSRHWLDFGDRSSRAINMPFLNLCYQTIVRANGRDYRIEVVGGLDGLKERIPEAELPAKLRSRFTTVGPAEKNYIRAALLAKYGGLWLEPGTIALKGFGPLPKDQVVFFGTDLDQTFSGTGGTAVPGFRAQWVPYMGHPLVVEAAAAAKRRLDGTNGGGQIRGDDKWDYVAFYQGRPGVIVDVTAELARKGKAGRRIELDDLLAAGQEGHYMFDVPASAVYLALPMRDIELRRQYGWFLRLSEDQILDSDLIISDLFRRVLSR